MLVQGFASCAGSMAMQSGLMSVLAAHRALSTAKKKCARQGPEQTHNGTRAFQRSTASAWCSHAVLDVTVFWMMVDEKKRAGSRLRWSLGLSSNSFALNTPSCWGSDRIRPRFSDCQTFLENTMNPRKFCKRTTCLPRILRECAQRRREWNSGVTQNTATLA